MAYLTAKELEEVKKKKKKQQTSVNTPSYLTSKDVKEIINKKNNVNIIPVKETPKKKATVLGTLGKIGTDIGTGFLKGGELLGDALQYGAANVAGWVGADKAKKTLIRNAKFDSTKLLTNPAKKLYDPVAYKPFKEGNIGSTIGEGIGQVGSMVASAGLLGGAKVGADVAKLSKVGKALNTAKTLLPSAIQGYGGGVTTGLEKGQSFGKSQLYGVGNAVVQAGSEGLFGGIGGVLGKGALDDIVVEGITNKIKSNLGKNLARIGIKSAGEGIEENIAGVLDPILQRMTIDKNADGYFTDENGKFTLTKAGQDFLVGAATSALLQSPSITQRNIETKQDNENQPLESDAQTNVLNNVNVLEKQESVLNEPKITNNDILPINENIKKGIPTAEDVIRTKKENQITKRYNKMLEEDLKVAAKEADKILYFDTTEQKNNFKELLNNYVKSNETISHEQLKSDIINNFKEKVIKNIDTNLKEIKKDVRGYRIKVSDDIKHNISDYNDFRKSNFGKLKLTNDGQSVDVVYQELSNKYPGIFSPEVVHPADQLLRISEMMNESVESFEKYNLDEGTIEKATQYVENFLNNETDLNTLIESIEISPKEVRKEKVKEYRMEARDYTENLFEWNDKKLGLQYSTETMERNLYDIIPNKTEANIIVDNYIRPITESNAQKEKFIHQYNDKIGKLNLNKNESVAVQMLGEYKYNPETTLTAEQTYSFIENNKLDKKRIESAVEVFRNTYDELIVKANATLKEQGYKEIPYRKGYFPHFNNESPTSIIGKMAEKLGWKVTKNTLPTDIAGMTDIFKPGKTWFGHSLQRKGDATDYNALQGYDNYIRGAADIIYHTENIQKIRALENEIRYQYSDDGVQEQIDSIYENSDLTSDEMQMEVEKVYETLNNPMPNLVTELREYANGLANKKHSSDRAMEHDMSRKMYSVMTNVNNRVAANMVGLNVSSAFTNFIPITQAWSQVSTPNMLKAMKQSINSNYKNDGFIDKSVFLTNRVNQAERLYKTGLEKVGDKANFMFEGIDGFTANVVVRGKYLENIQKGMNESEAIKNADIFAKNVLGGRDKGSLPTVFNRKNPLTKVFTMFQLEVKNQYGYMFKDLPRDMEKEGLAKLTGAFIKMFFGAWLYNKVAESLTGRKSAFSPTDIIADIAGIATDESLSASKKFSGVVEEISQDIPFIGGLVGGGRVPISAALPNVGTTVSSAATMFSEEDDAKKQTAMNNLMKELSKPVIYLVPPFGGGQAKKTIEGLGMYKKEIPGSYTTRGKLRFPVKDDIPTKAQAALFGQYASKEAREYFDENRRPLSQNQVEQMKSSKDWKETYDLILKQREYDALNNKYKKLVESGKSTKEIQKQIDNFWQK